MTAQTLNPATDETVVTALEERVAAIVAESVYKRLRAEVLMAMTLSFPRKSWRK